MIASFWKSITLVLAFFILTPIAVGTSLFTLLTLETQEIVVSPLAQKPIYGAQVYASLPAKSPIITAEIQAEDARPEIIRQYLADYRSPLEPYANHLVAEADKNGLDFRLTTAIAQQESNLCKIFPPTTHNCWGWGIHSAGTLGFSSFEEAISVVSLGLKENYIDEGYVTPGEIMTKYTPMSNGSWAAGVSEFMAQMQ